MKKTCPKNHTTLDYLYSINKMWCFECRKMYDFKLKKNQKSILIDGLKGGMEEHKVLDN